MDNYIYNDGGRMQSGFKGNAGDCVCRAIAIATEKPYKEIYDLINKFAQREKTGAKKRGKSHARTGVYKQTIKKVMEQLGWKWVPTMAIGKGCSVHLDKEELPKGRLVVALSKHATAVIDGVVNDIYDPRRIDESGRNTRCVYGYYIKNI